MAAVAIGLVATVFALTKIIVLAGVALEGHRGKFTSLVGAVAKRLLAAQAAHAKVILLTSFKRYFYRFVVCDYRIAHVSLNGWL